MPTPIARKLLQCLNSLPSYCSLFSFYCRFVVRNGGNPIWFEAIYTSIPEFHTIKTTQQIFTNLISGEWVRDLLPIERSIKSRSLRLLVRWGGMSGDMVWATIDNDSIKAKNNPTIL